MQHNHEITDFDFGNYYSHFYAHECGSDSPERSRLLLANQIARTCLELLTSADKSSRLKLLDLGSGKQSLLLALAQIMSAEYFERIDYISLDISEIDKNTLPSPVSHVQASGSDMPFEAKSFDIIFSNLAVDYMNRTVFFELSRCISKRGVVLLHLNHPHLVDVALSRQSLVLQKIRTYKQKCRFGTSSRNYSRYKQLLAEYEREQETINFFVDIYPKLIFFSISEIQQQIDEYFPSSTNRVEIYEQTQQKGDSGWYVVRIQNDTEPDYQSDIIGDYVTE